jgi:hypothetical protein
VESEVGRGTTFDRLFPLTEDPVAEAPAPAAVRAVLDAP